MTGTQSRYIYAQKNMYTVKDVLLCSQQSWPQRSLFLQKWLHCLVLPKSDCEAVTFDKREKNIWNISLPLKKQCIDVQYFLFQHQHNHRVSKCSAWVCSRCGIFPLSCSLICRLWFQCRVLQSLSRNIIWCVVWIISSKPPGSRVIHIELLLDV